MPKKHPQLLRLNGQLSLGKQTKSEKLVYNLSNSVFEANFHEKSASKSWIQE